ncbi:mechanosensitive ion channel domain-containing protein [Psychroserpens luteolus]|uniref:mechanosensitive ion channel domain-containing protein n=1 Tax=Psychroserpens luteolus TaxID=2855840 RepID=UPI001E2D42EF|nr:mechanosensitive ion channel domain-containing protein [Psychroserpens luteolus]MCD2259664.1 mechanosensitive ion channel family protein [Psychroserpens luteolus]
MSEFFTTYHTQIINSCIVFGIFFIIQLIARLVVRVIGNSKKIHVGRAKLVGRYITISFLFIAILIEAFILGVSTSDLALVFSSVFAVIGIGLFAIWSILSNVTSGIIMFFSFPYKIGDKIKIHDKDYEIEAIIEDIRSFQIHLRKDNGNLVTYPNNLLLQKAITLIEKDAFESLEDDGSDYI